MGASHGLVLAPPRPNPARDGTVLDFVLPRSGRVTLDIFDASGRRVRRVLDDRLPAGAHAALWRGDDERGADAGDGL